MLARSGACKQQPALSSSLALALEPPPIAPGAQMRGRENCRIVLQRRGAERSERERVASKANPGLGELVLRLQDSILSEASTLPTERRGAPSLTLPMSPAHANSELKMARLIVALACAAGVSAFLAPSTTAPAKTVVFGKGGELRDRKNQCGHILGSCRPFARARCTGGWLQQQALQQSSWLSNFDAKKRPPRDKTPAAPRPPKLQKKKSRPRAS